MISRGLITNQAHMVEETRHLSAPPCRTSSSRERTETKIVQRARGLPGTSKGIFERDLIDVLRPATPGAIKPHELDAVLGTRVLRALSKGQELRWTDLGA
jgi:N-acetylneuraminate synthase